MKKYFLVEFDDSEEILTIIEIDDSTGVSNIKNIRYDSSKKWKFQNNETYFDEVKFKEENGTLVDFEFIKEDNNIDEETKKILKENIFLSLFLGIKNFNYSIKMENEDTKARLENDCKILIFSDQKSLVLKYNKINIPIFKLLKKIFIVNPDRKTVISGFKKEGYKKYKNTAKIIPIVIDDNDRLTGNTFLAKSSFIEKYKNEIKILKDKNVIKFDYIFDLFNIKKEDFENFIKISNFLSLQGLNETQKEIIEINKIMKEHKLKTYDAYLFYKKNILNKNLNSKEEERLIKSLKEN